MKKVLTVFITITVFLSFAGLAVSGQTNLARMEGATYSWSGTWENNGLNSTAGDPGSKCFDGDINTKWGSANVANGDQWVAVTFAQAVTISGFKTWQDQGVWTNITGFKAQIQNGSETWTDVYTSPTYTAQWASEEKVFDSPITATAFRIYIPAANAGGKTAVELTELEIYDVIDNPSTSDNVFAVITLLAVSLSALVLVRKKSLGR